MKDIKEEVLSPKIKELMIKQGASLMKLFIQEKVPFKVVIWNYDNWDEPLPEEIMIKYPMQ